uniref:transposase family protein n=1 Tax=Evansella halocellulosilytica TaxID=2011013 RepID=UPI00387EC9E0
MNFPGLEDMIVTKSEVVEGALHLHVEMERKRHRCPACSEVTRRVHDYRTQKIQHLKVFERNSFLFYRKRRYVCSCGKKFPEKTRVVERYQRHSMEWNQALGLRIIQAKNFKDTARQFHTSPTSY